MENQHINESILSEEILEDQKKNRIDHMKYMPGMEDIGLSLIHIFMGLLNIDQVNKFTKDERKWTVL